MNGPIGTVRFMHEHGGIGHISPDTSGPLEVWVGNAWVAVAELIDDHQRFCAMQTVFRVAGLIK